MHPHHPPPSHLQRPPPSNASEASYYSTADYPEQGHQHPIPNHGDRQQPPAQHVSPGSVGVSNGGPHYRRPASPTPGYARPHSSAPGAVLTSNAAGYPYSTHSEHSRREYDYERSYDYSGHTQAREQYTSGSSSQMQAQQHRLGSRQQQPQLSRQQHPMHHHHVQQHAVPPPSGYPPHTREPSGHYTSPSQPEIGSHRLVHRSHSPPPPTAHSALATSPYSSRQGPPPTVSLDSYGQSPSQPQHHPAIHPAPLPSSNPAAIHTNGRDSNQYHRHNASYSSEGDGGVHRGGYNYSTGSRAPQSASSRWSESYPREYPAVPVPGSSNKSPQSAYYNAPQSLVHSDRLTPPQTQHQNQHQLQHRPARPVSPPPPVSRGNAHHSPQHHSPSLAAVLGPKNPTPYPPRPTDHHSAITRPTVPPQSDIEPSQTWPAGSSEYSSRSGVQEYHHRQRSVSMDENMDREKTFYGSYDHQYPSSTMHPTLPSIQHTQVHVQAPAHTRHAARASTPPGQQYSQSSFASPPAVSGYHSHEFNQTRRSPSLEPVRAPKSQAMSISQLLSDKTSRDVTPEFLKESSPPRQYEKSPTRIPTPPVQQWPSPPLMHAAGTAQVYQQPINNEGPGSLIQQDEYHATTVPATISQGPVIQQSDSQKTHTVPAVKESVPKENGKQPESVQHATTPLGTTNVVLPKLPKKGRPKTVATYDKKLTSVKVEEKPLRLLAPAEVLAKPKRGRKPKVKEVPPQPARESSPQQPMQEPPGKQESLTTNNLKTHDSAATTPAERFPEVLTIPKNGEPTLAVGAASKRTRSESPADENVHEEAMEFEQGDNGTSGYNMMSPKLFSSDDDSDQEDYSQHQELMAYRLEVHKRATRVRKAYEKQSMAKRRKLHEKFVAKQQKRLEKLEEDEMDQELEESESDNEELTEEATPSPAPTPTPTSKGGRGKKKTQRVAADDSAIKEEQVEEQLVKETKAEKRKRERREAAEVAALAKAQELHGDDFDDQEDEDDDSARVPRADGSNSDNDDGDESSDNEMEGSIMDDDQELEEPELDEATIARMQEADYENKRRNLWDLIAHVQIPQMNKILASTTSTRQQNCKLVAQMCRRYSRKAASRSVKLNKDLQTRAKRATREMLTFWKRNEREELLLRKKAEKEAIEKLRIEEEMREARRQARKLNFLITQTELYSHFIGKKIGTEAAEADEDAAPVRTRPVENPAEASITQDPDHQPIEGELDFEEASDEMLAAQAKWGAQQALVAAQARTQAFDDAAKEEHANIIVGHGKSMAPQPSLAGAQDTLDEMNFQNPSSMPTIAEIEQPTMLMCQLKGYQIKGLNWLANLYEQGINGILADEMGLGKTVQSISLMAHLAETHNIWGPFLVIAPASTLHNWQQEFTKFTPGLRALPYWGDPNDRATLRKVWCRKQIYNKDSPFHVLITSYQLVVSDEKYFQRVKWQYMVLDEAQAIKSSSSNRWKTLLGFNCRNRLLLTGTPIQNSMQELWALLHFIMPSLFDSHEEFSEWFSKDIESHAENKGTLNEHQLKRLHMILKPFMLRRIKKNVQNELGDKIEVELSCELTARQKALYRGLKAKISIAELLESASSLDDADSVDSLMNLVMQFRKVCNHPELFERADVMSPFALCEFSQTPSIARESDDLYLAYTTKSQIQFSIPKRLFRDGGMLRVPSEGSRIGTDTKYLDNLLNIWHPSHIAESQWEQDGAFSFLRFADQSPSQASRIFRGHLLDRFALDLEDRRVQASRGTVEYELCSNDDDNLYSIPEDTFAKFLIHGMSEPLSLRNQSLLSHTRDICQTLSRCALSEYLPLMEPAYRPKAIAPPIEMICSDRGFLEDQQDVYFDRRMRQMLVGVSEFKTEVEHDPDVAPMKDLWNVNGGQGLLGEPSLVSKGYSSIEVPQMKQLVMDSGKLAILDKLLVELKAGGHRVLLYFQMTKMIDLMEEYLTYRQYKYLRLDGSSKISDRRDMVTDWQTRPEIFIFLLSTRAGGLGINLTAADTVIFYDSDWNPTVDQQAMDRAHRLGQTRQVTVYRLITKGTIEERILQRAKQKDEIQKVVISGGEFKQSVDFKPREIVSLLLDDDELAGKLQEQQLKRKAEDEAKTAKKVGGKDGRPAKRSRKDNNANMNSNSTTVALSGYRDSSAVSTPSAAAVVLSTPGGSRNLDEMWAEIDSQEASMAAAAVRAEEEEIAQLKAFKRRGGGGSSMGARIPRVPKEKVVREKVVKEKVPKEPKPKKEKVIKEKVPKEKKPPKAMKGLEGQPHVDGEPVSARESVVSNGANDLDLDTTELDVGE